MNWHSTALLDQIHPDPAEIFDAGLAQHHLANTAYPIGHLTTMHPYHVPRWQVQHLASLAWRDVDRLGLYVHVPFCESRCKYCEYCVVEPEVFHASEDTYFELLMREFDLYRQAANTSTKTLIGFDIGGGTPAAAKVGQIARVVEAARKSFTLSPDVTISIETTPRIAALQPEKMHAFYETGIRRISMGVQTINPRLLEDVGRPHTSLDYNRTAVENIRSAGFRKFNIDVMYGFAGQELGSVEATLKHVISLEPEYVTLYRMRYKGTRLAGQAQFVALDEVSAQYMLAKEMLLAAGYWGTPGKNTFSRLDGDVGTSDYLTERVIHGTPYLGLGLGAQSLSQYTLSYNSGAADKQLRHYQRQIEAGQLPIQDLYHLSCEAAMGKMIAVSFYFGEINLASFHKKFGFKLEEACPREVEFVLEKGLMAYDKVAGGRDEGKVLRLTGEGVKVYNGVIALFYAGAVKAYLLDLTQRLPKSVISPQVMKHLPQTSEVFSLL
jgi:oxygen-independent coproporphyrinogen-3 oxidase